MTHKEQVAYHEAAHVVLAIYYKMGVSGGIDLNAATSVDGAFGNASVNLFVIEGSASIEDQRLLAQNLAVICAGACSDAKAKGVEPLAALLDQPSDLEKAMELARQSGLVNQTEAKYVVEEVGLKLAIQDLAKKEVWEAVVRVAKAVLAANGELSKEEVEKLGIVVSPTLRSAI